MRRAEALRAVLNRSAAASNKDDQASLLQTHPPRPFYFRVHARKRQALAATASVPALGERTSAMDYRLQIVQALGFPENKPLAAA
jgi:hypothetical protein